MPPSSLKKTANLQSVLQDLLQRLNVLDKAVGTLSELETVAESHVKRLAEAYQKREESSFIAYETNYDDAKEKAKHDVEGLIQKFGHEVEVKLVLQETFEYFFFTLDRPHSAVANIRDIAHEMRHLKSIQRENLKKEIARKGINIG